MNRNLNWNTTGTTFTKKIFKNLWYTTFSNQVLLPKVFYISGLSQRLQIGTFLYYLSLFVLFNSLGLGYLYCYYLWRYNAFKFLFLLRFLTANKTQCRWPRLNQQILTPLTPKIIEVNVSFHLRNFILFWYMNRSVAELVSPLVPKRREFNF